VLSNRFSKWMLAASAHHPCRRRTGWHRSRISIWFSFFIELGNEQKFFTLALPKTHDHAESGSLPVFGPQGLENRFPSPCLICQTSQQEFKGCWSS
jgi:hypothetical protein